MTRRPRWALGIMPVAVLLAAAAVAEETVEGAAETTSEPRIGRFGEDTRVSEAEFEFSEAERMLWLSDHMTDVDIVSGTTLRYAFMRTSALGDGFEDEVRMQVLKTHTDGSKDVSVKFFGGQRKQPVMYPENLSQVRGNPVLGLYLQGDVQDMNRMTEGSWRYFQRLIKLAISENATVEQIELQYNDRVVEAQRITIRPYDDDPKKIRYLKFADKLYEFVLSKEVPGTLYSIRTVMLEAGKGGKERPPLVEEQLIFSGSDAADTGSS